MLILIGAAATVASGILFLVFETIPNIAANLNALRHYEYLE